MIFTETKLSGAYIIELDKQIDNRGYFARTFCVNEFKEMKLHSNYVQANTAFNNIKGTLRGLHYQKSPHEEVKLVRVTKGALFDIIVDLRIDSPTYKKWFGLELTEENGKMLYIPEGFAHGYITLKDNTEITYMVSNFYTPNAESGLRYNDPAFKIDWPTQVKLRGLSL